MESIDKYLRDSSFFLFGMGCRKKMIFCSNCLFDVFSGKLLYRFSQRAAAIIPEEYQVITEDAEIYENEAGVYLKQGGQTISLTEGYLNIPEFAAHPNRKALRILFHEITVNIVDGQPVPNLFVYQKPWYRDAAMMCMVLERTGNLHLVYDWILSLEEVYDRNNAGNCEPDNLGQALYMISLVSDSTHPLVPKILREAGKWKEGNHIAGLTDGKKHPVYQTKWLKYGLKKLGLPDPYEVPKTEDDYAELFWMDFKDRIQETTAYVWEASDYPYLEVAKAHYHRQECPVPEKISYPLTWEKNASEADYSRNLPFLSKLQENRMCAPHTWHAAELYLWMTEE